VYNNPDGYTDSEGNFYREGCISEDAGIQIIEDSGKKRLRFHNNAYFRDFKNAWLKYYEKLVEDEDEILLRNFNNSLARIGVREVRF
jgi:hypothetical protein